MGIRATFLFFSIILLPFLLRILLLFYVLHNVLALSVNAGINNTKIIATNNYHIIQKRLDNRLPITDICSHVIQSLSYNWMHQFFF